MNYDTFSPLQVIVEHDSDLARQEQALTNAGHKVVTRGVSHGWMEPSSRIFVAGHLGFGAIGDRAVPPHPLLIVSRIIASREKLPCLAANSAVPSANRPRAIFALFVRQSALWTRLLLDH